jgi:hypothetical protein
MLRPTVQFFQEVIAMAQRTFERGILVVAVAAAAAVAQTNSGVTAPAASPIPAGAPASISLTGTLGGGFAGGPLNRVTGQPFSAQEETETVQTLADGTHITNGTQKVMHYRDSLGRTRTERTPMQLPGFLGASGAAPPVFIEIADPVAGYRYSFDSNGHTAHRAPFGPVRVRKMLPSPAGSAYAVGDPAPVAVVAPMAPAGTKGVFSSAGGVNPQGPRPEISNERLGTQTIEGVLAEGTRMTTTYPVGFLGNDRPVTTVTETWTSREIGMAILTRTSDPRSGESTTKLMHISRAEPDPSLFQPPAGYQVLDQSGQPVE